VKGDPKKPDFLSTALAVVADSRFKISDNSAPTRFGTILILGIWTLRARVLHDAAAVPMLVPDALRAH
jgi:hypothetical protein